MLEPLQLNAGLEHTSGVAARLAARAAGARSTNGKRTLEIEEVIVAQSFSTKGKRGKSMLLFHAKKIHHCHRGYRYNISELHSFPWVISNLHQNVSHSIGVGLY